MGGKTKKIDTTPDKTMEFRNQISGYLNDPRSGGGYTQSVDQLGGANSAFFQNMMGHLKPAFDQERAEGLAGAKEAAGTLTGSGFANRLGASVNRSLGQEDATLADYATRGLSLEQQRQQAQANNFTNLLGNQGSLGVGPATVQKSGGFGSFLGKVGGGILGSALGPVGSAIGAGLGKKVGSWF